MVKACRIFFWKPQIKFDNFTGFTKYTKVNLVVINYEMLVNGRFDTLVPLFPLGIDYTKAVTNSSTLGHELYHFFKSFLSNCDCGNNLHVIAISLGVHILHYVAKDLDKDGTKLKYITALDAAGPLFYGADRFTKNDGVFVDAIHTNGGGLGLDEDYGTVDFYINGGRKQPSCANKTICKCCIIYYLKYS